MADFNILLQQTAFEAPKPKNFPDGIYRGSVHTTKLDRKAIKDRDSGQELDKIIVSIVVKPTSWPEGLSEEETQGLSLQGKQFSKDYFIDVKKLANGDKSDLWAVDQLLRSCGVASGSGKTYEETLPSMVGAEVDFEISTRTYKNKSGEDEQTNQVKRLIGLAHSA